MSDAKVMQAQQQSNVAWSLGQRLVKRDEYANQVTIERRDHDAVLRFHLCGEDCSSLVCEITVPLGALEGLA